MSTAALEHLGTGGGQKPLLCVWKMEKKGKGRRRKKNRTEKLYVDRVFVCNKKQCTVKDLPQVVTTVEETDSTTCDGIILTVDFAITTTF